MCQECGRDSSKHPRWLSTEQMNDDCNSTSVTPKMSNKSKNGTLSDSHVPMDVKIIPLAWIMKIKVLPNGSLDCYKARMCTRGDLQVSDGSSTCDPVVKWAATRSVLAFAIKHDLCSRQVDFLNAFAQANLPEGKHVHACPPPGFRHACGEKVLKLRKAFCPSVLRESC